MAGSGYSGINGNVLIGSTPIAEIRGWKFNPKSNNPRYASNFTSGYKRTVAGVKEGSGSMSGAHTTTNPFLAVIDVGTSVTLLLYTDSSHFFSVPSVIDDVSINVDLDNGEIVGWDANFSTNGAWANPSAPMRMNATGPSMGTSGAEMPPQAPPTASMLSPEIMQMIARTAAMAALEAVQAAGIKITTP